MYYNLMNIILMNKLLEDTVKQLKSTEPINFNIRR